MNVTTDPKQLRPRVLQSLSDHPIRLPFSWILFVPAIVSMGYALDLKAGTFADDAMGWIVISGILAVVALVLSRLAIAPDKVPTIIAIFQGTAIVWSFYMCLRFLPVHPNNLKVQDGDELFTYFSGLGMAAVLAGAVASARPFLLRATFPAIVVIFFALNIWLINHTKPYIDVLLYQRDSTAALMLGHNPYAITFEDPYGGRSPWFGPGLAANGRLLFGFPYMPVSLLMSLPGHWMGDVRYSQAIAAALAALLMGYSRGGSRISFAAAVLFMFMSRTAFTIEEGWTEPFLVFALALVAFCGSQFPRIMPYTLGLFFVSKQYLPLAAPLALLLCDWPLKWRQVAGIAWRAILAGAIVTLPLALWNWTAFWHSAVKVQMMAPFRKDALSLLAWWYSQSGAADGIISATPSAAWAFVALLVATVLSLLFAPRNVAGFCAAVAVTFFAFFAFNKQAFMNYYFFVLAAMCCALAVAAPREAKTAG